MYKLTFFFFFLLVIINFFLQFCAIYGLAVGAPMAEEKTSGKTSAEEIDDVRHVTALRTLTKKL